MFSIVMLTWNNYEKFHRCIHSMFHMMLDDRVEEILILDNGSHEMKLLNLLKKLNKLLLAPKIWVLPKEESSYFKKLPAIISFRLIQMLLFLTTRLFLIFISDLLPKTITGCLEAAGEIMSSFHL